MDQDIKSGHWFVDLLMKFAPKPEDVIVTGTPEEMIREAAGKTFWVSTTLSAVWGPVGLATVLPEIMAVMKIQMNLVYKIANYHQKQNVPHHTAIVLIFANALGLTIGPRLLRTAGTRLIVKSLSLPVISAIARKIGAEMVTKISQRAAGRWIPLLAAPIFGHFSRKMTIKIGSEAERLFSQVIDPEGAVS
ncbi:MAG: hypothetical protein PHN75_09120 [Syntrophales bacterium]|nr:hypothetical protein [Syntrophales bacterium]